MRRVGELRQLWCPRLLSVRLILLLLAGCRDAAADYRDALAAPDWDAARGLCLRLDQALAGDCLVSVLGRLGRTERADCDVVKEQIWHEECLFQYAERAAKAGQLQAAFDACEASAYGRECSFHLVRQASEGVLDREPAEAAAVIGPYLAMEAAPDAPRLFWRAWWRDRLAKKLPVDPTGCPDDACRQGAQETIYTTLHALARAQGEAFCGTLPTSARTWVSNPTTDAWVREWQQSECRRREISPAPP